MARLVRRGVRSVRVKRTLRKKRAARTRRSGGVRKPRPVLAVPQLSECAKDYLVAQYDPWRVKKPICIPDNIQTPSHKMKLRSVGTFSTNAAGFGYIALNPWTPSSAEVSSAVTNKAFLAPIVCTNSTAGATGVMVGVSADVTVANDVWVTPQYFTQSGITSDQMGTDINAINDGPQHDWRLVAAGIKVQYAGREDDIAGQYGLYSDPASGKSLFAQKPIFSDLVSKEEASRCAVGRQEVAVTYHPRHHDDNDYMSEWGLTATTVAPYHNMCIAVTGSPGAGSGASFTYDIVAHYEVIGTHVPNKTPSHADPTGIAQISNGFPQAPPTGSITETLSDAIDTVSQGMTQGMYIAGQGLAAAGMVAAGWGKLKKQYHAFRGNH